MDTVRVLLYLSVCLPLATTGSRGPARDPPQPLYHQLGFSTNDLWKLLQDDSRSVEKKASIIPRCEVGERCAMKHGPRIGRLCECLRGAACNSFFLRCY